MLTKNQYFDLSNIDRDNKLFAINNYIWIDSIKSFVKEKKKKMKNQNLFSTFYSFCIHL